DSCIQSSDYFHFRATNLRVEEMVPSMVFSLPLESSVPVACSNGDLCYAMVSGLKLERKVNYEPSPCRNRWGSCPQSPVPPVALVKGSPDSSSELSCCSCPTTPGSRY